MASLKDSTWRDIVRVKEDYLRKHRLGVAGQGRAYVPPTDVVQVKNSAGGQVNQGYVVQIGNSLLDDPGDPGNQWFNATYPTDPWERVWGIALEPIQEDEIGSCQLSGVCLAQVWVTDTAHRFAWVTHDESPFLLRSGFAGQYELLMPAPSVAVHMLPVRYCGLGGTPRRAVLHDNLTQGMTNGFADLVRWAGGVWQKTGKGVTVVDYWLNNGEHIPADTKVLLNWQIGDAFWIVDQAYCKISNTLPSEAP
jgi:hypothetical protein